MQKNIDKLEKEANKLLDLCCEGFGNKKISDRLKEIEEKKRFVEYDFITPEKVRKALKMDISSLNLKSQEELKKLIQKWIIKIELTTTEAIIYFNLRRL